MPSVVWTSLGSGSWNGKANWIDSVTGQQRIPNGNDDVLIPTGGITVFIGVNAVARTLEDNATLVVTGGGLTIESTQSWLPAVVGLVTPSRTWSA